MKAWAKAMTDLQLIVLEHVTTDCDLNYNMHV